jgi:hypothetical protein
MNHSTVRSAHKAKAVQEQYLQLGDKFDTAVIEDLVTGDLAEALQGVSCVAGHLIKPRTDHH